MSKQSPDFISKPERSSLKDQREGTEQSEFLYRSKYTTIYTIIQQDPGPVEFPALHQPSLQSAKVLHFPSNNRETKSHFSFSITNKF